MTKKMKRNSKKKEKITFKSIINSTKFLTVVFILLLILVIVLIVLCSKKEQESKNNGFANIGFSLLDAKLPADFNINALTLASTDEYIFKVSNYRGNKVSKKEIKYSVIIENNTDSVISVTVNDLKDDLMTKQEHTEFTDTLKKKEKETVYYHVKVISKGKLDSRDLINVKISD